jgi:ATP-dependent DNA ligase
MHPKAENPRLSSSEFQMPELVSKAPAGSDWIHENKYDGRCAGLGR